MDISVSHSRLPGCATQIFVVLFILCAEIPGVCQSSGLLWQQLSAATIAPTGPTGFSADQLLSFAEQLMREGEYFRAITEYRRFLFYYPDDPRHAMVHFSIGLALYRGESYVEALQSFQEVTQHYPNTAYGKQAWLWQGESLIRQGQYTAAEQLYTELTDAGVEVLYDDRAESAGVKFNDADLVGLPLRVVVSKRSLKNGGIELKLRSQRESRIVPMSEAVKVIQEEIRRGMMIE